MPAERALHSGREQIDAVRDVRHRQQRRDAAEQHEQRVAGRMRDAERVRRGDVFARVPHRRRRRQRHDVEHQNGCRRQCRRTIGWAKRFVHRGGHASR